MEIVTVQELVEVMEQLGEQLKVHVCQAAEAGCAPTYYRRAEAAHYLRISVVSLDRLTASGRIRRAKIGDGPKGTVLYRKVDLDAFVETSLELDLADAQAIARGARN